MKTQQLRRILTAQLEQDERGWWLVELVEEPQVHTFGRTVTQALEHVRDAAALWFDVPPDTLVFVPEITGNEVLAAALEDAKRERVRLAAAEQVARIATTTAVQTLTGSGLSRRDVAVLLGVSHQRVHQILRTEDAAV